MSLQVLLVALFAVSCRAGLVGFGGAGTSTSSRQQSDGGAYNFNYAINDGVGGGSGRWEAGDGAGGVVGFYTLNGPDGRARRVEYVADALGYRARVNTNELGTAKSTPAAAAIESPFVGPVAPAPVLASGAVGSYSSAVNHAHFRSPYAGVGAGAGAYDAGAAAAAAAAAAKAAALAQGAAAYNPFAAAAKAAAAASGAYYPGYDGGFVPAPPGPGVVAAAATKYH